MKHNTDQPHLVMPTLHTAMIAGLEKAMNKALALDPSTQKRLASLQNHCFHLHCTAPQKDLYFIPGEKEVRLCGVYPGTANTTLSGSISAFIELLSSSDPASTLINSTLKLHGDSSALITLQKIAHDLDLDWEQPLAALFGDVIGHQIGKGVRHSLQFGKQLLKGLRRQIDDYVVEESNCVPARWEVEKYFNDVDQLAMRSERLAAKFNKFSQRTPLK